MGRDMAKHLASVRVDLSSAVEEEPGKVVLNSYREGYFRSL